MDELSRAILNSQIFSFMATTYIQPIKKASAVGSYRAHVIHLPVLSYLCQGMTLDNQPALNGWRLQTRFKKILSELGGVPQLVEWFIKSTDRQGHGSAANDLNHIDWREARRDLMWSGNPYLLGVDSTEQAQRILDVIMLRTKLHVDDKVLSDDPTVTYDSLQHCRRIVLQEHPSDASCVCASSPLCAFREHVDRAWDYGSKAPNRYRKLWSLMNQSPTH